MAAQSQTILIAVLCALLLALGLGAAALGIAAPFRGSPVCVAPDSLPPDMVGTFATYEWNTLHPGASVVDMANTKGKTDMHSFEATTHTHLLTLKRLTPCSDFDGITSCVTFCAAADQLAETRNAPFTRSFVKEASEPCGHIGKSSM